MILNIEIIYTFFFIVVNAYIVTSSIQLPGNKLRQFIRSAGSASRDWHLSYRKGCSEAERVLSYSFKAIEV